MAGKRNVLYKIDWCIYEAENEFSAGYRFFKMTFKLCCSGDFNLRGPKLDSTVTENEFSATKY